MDVDPTLASALIGSVRRAIAMALPQLEVVAQNRSRIEFAWMAKEGFFHRIAVRIMPDTNRFSVDVWWSEARKAPWSGGAEPETARANPDRGMSLSRLWFKGRGFVPSWAIGAPDPSPARKNDMTFPTPEDAANDVAAKLLEFGPAYFERCGPSAGPEGR
ncbi:MAG: hypothetical protein U1E65_03470 [Myxococcota bacterium]